jgi:hypothetical protein
VNQRRLVHRWRRYLSFEGYSVELRPDVLPKLHHAGENGSKCDGGREGLADLASALERVSGTRVRAQLAMPIFLRRLFLNDLHHMFLYFETQGLTAEPDALKNVIADPLSAEDWFRFHNRYANGDSIVPGT